MLVYICCAGGATSSLFAQKIQEAGGDQIIIEGIWDIMPNLENYLKEYKLVLAYGPVSILTDAFMKEHHLEDKLKAVWIAPQVRFMKDTIKKQLSAYSVSVDTIDMLVFGQMNGKKALHTIIERIKETRAEEKKPIQPEKNDL